MFATLTAEKVGENLKHLIKESEYRTQGAFANALSKDARVIRRWIKEGIRSIETINEVAAALKVDVMALLF